MIDYDCVVVGAGPAGMACALYLKRANMNVLIIDKEAPGGNVLKAKIIENYLGVGRIKGSDLAFNMYKQLKENEVSFELGMVKNILGKKGSFKVCVDEKIFKCKNVVIATGKGFGRFSLDDGKIAGISYCAICDGSFYKNKTVGVYGVGEQLYVDALYLADLCDKVYLFVSDKANLNSKVLSVNNIEVVVGRITNLNSKLGQLSSVVLDNGSIYDLSGLFISLKKGFSLPITLKMKNGGIDVDDNMLTSIDGIYAVGDVRFKKYYQISTAVNDGIIAALNIKEEKYE